MKKVTALAILLSPLAAFAQDKVVKHKVSLNLTEEFHVLNDKKDVKQGLYLVTDAQGGAVVRGKYDDNKKVGTWMFYDPNNKLVQQYDYTNNKMTYYNYDSESYVKTDYDFDVKDTTGLQVPVKIGGSTLAFLTFYNSKDIPPAITKEKADINITYTINVEPTGQIGDVFADYESNGTQEQKKVYVKPNSSGLLDFIPAKISGKPIKSKVMLSTTIQANKVTVYGFYNSASSQKN